MSYPVGPVRRKCIFVVFVIFGISAACVGSTHAPAPVEATGKKLEVALSEPFPIERMPPLVAASWVTTPAMACGASRCFAAFQQTFSGARAANYGTRVDGDGKATDVPLISLNASGTPSYVGARGDEFLVASQVSTSATATVYALERIRGTDGARVGDIVSLTLPHPLLAVAGSGPGWLLLSGASSAIRAQAYDADLNPLASPLDITYDSSQAKLIAGEGQFLVAVAGKAYRISASTGLAIDAAPLAFAKYNSAVSLGAYVNGIYFLTWPSGGNYYGSRIRASTGELLDPDDDFNQKPGAKLLCASCISVSDPGGMYTAAAIGGKGVLLWKAGMAGTPKMYAVGVDMDTGLRPGGVTTMPPDLGSIPGTPAIALRGLGDKGTLQSTNSLYPISFNQTATLIAGAPLPIARERESHGGPRVASNGTGYLVVFGGSNKLFATRIDPQSGAYLDDPPLQLANSIDGVSAVTSLGSDYLVVWVVNMYGVLGRAIVHADGTVKTLPNYDIPTTLGVWIENLKVTANGTYYLIAWRTSILLQGIRLMPDGSTQVDADPVDFDATLSSMSTAFTVLGDTTPAPDRKSFLFFYRPTSDAVVRRFRSESGTVVSPLTTIATGVAGQDFMTAATDGTRVLATWVLNNANETLHAGLVDPVSGTLVAGSETSVMDIGNSRLLGPSWYDGVGWNMIVLDIYDKSTLSMTAHLQRLDSNLKRLDANVPGWGTLLADLGMSQFCDAASAGNGRTLFTYASFDVAYMGTRMRGRFIDNDGTPAPPGTGGSGGAGGGNGTGGSGGTGGRGGAVGSGGSSSGTGGNVVGTGGSLGGTTGGTGGAAGVVGTIDASGDSRGEADGRDGSILGTGGSMGSVDGAAGGTGGIVVGIDGGGTGTGGSGGVDGSAVGAGGSSTPIDAGGFGGVSGRLDAGPFGAGGAGADTAGFGGTGGRAADSGAGSGDSSAGRDGGAAETVGKSSGCSCSTGRAHAPGRLASFAGAALLLLVWRRRGKVSRA